MRILIVTDPFKTLRDARSDSAETFIVNRANELVELGHDVDIITDGADETNLFNVIRFKESIHRMYDDSFRPSTEEQGQQYFRALQYGLFDVAPYDVIHYICTSPELFEMGALHDKPALVELYKNDSERWRKMYTLFTQRTDARAIAFDDSRSVTEYVELYEAVVKEYRHA